MSFASLCFSLFLFDIIFLYGVVVAVHFATLSFSLPLLLFIAVVGNHPLSSHLPVFPPSLEML